MTTLTPEELTALVALREGITPGEWSIEPGANSHMFDARIMSGEQCIAFAEGDVVDDDTFEPSADARAIAAVPRQFDAIETLMAENARLQDMLLYIAETSDDEHISDKAFAALNKGAK